MVRHRGQPSKTTKKRHFGLAANSGFLSPSSQRKRPNLLQRSLKVSGELFSRSNFLEEEKKDLETFGVVGAAEELKQEQQLQQQEQEIQTLRQEVLQLQQQVLQKREEKE